MKATSKRRSRKFHKEQPLVFTPLYNVLSTTGGMGRELQTFYKRLVDMLAHKREARHAHGLAPMQTLLFHHQICRYVHQRKQISSRHHPIKETDTCSEGCVHAPKHNLYYYCAIFMHLVIHVFVFSFQPLPQNHTERERETNSLEQLGLGI